MHSRLVAPDHKRLLPWMHYMSLNRVCLLSLSPRNRVWIRVVPKTSSFWVRVNTTRTRAIKQLGIYFGSVSIFFNESSLAPLIHSCRGISRPSALWQPWIRDNFSIFLLLLLFFIYFVFTYHWTGHSNRIPICIIIIVRNRVANSAHSRVDLRKHSQGRGSWILK